MGRARSCSTSSRCTSCAARACGCTIVEGRSYLDVYNNVPHVGHTPSDGGRARSRSQTAHAGDAYALSARTASSSMRNGSPRRCRGISNACIFVNSGSEANDVAWRIAQFATGHTGRPGHAARLPRHHRRRGRADAGRRGAAGSAGGDAAAPPRDRAPARSRSTRRGRSSRPPPQRMPIGAIARSPARGFAPAAFFIDTALTSSGIFDPPPGWAARRVGAGAGRRRPHRRRRGAVRTRPIAVRISGDSSGAVSSRTSSRWASRWATAIPWASSSPTAP